MANEVNSLYEFSGFRFDGGTHELRQNGDLILLSPKASELLTALLERQGEFVTKREIFEKVWAGTFVEDGVLTQNIYTLRKALGTDAGGQPLIENRTRLGYRITVPVRALQKSDGNFGSSGGNRREILLAALETRTEIITEEITGEYSPKLVSVKRGENWKKIGVVFAAGIALFSLTGFLAYLFLRPQPKNVSRIIIENIRFQKVTDTGDILFPALSPDGNLAAYRKKDGVYVKDLRTSAETKLEISNVERFGFLQFSPDGNFIYLRNRSSFFLPSKILKVSRYGGEAKSVADNVWSGFSLSPDEKQIAFARRFPNENRQGLFLKNLENGEEKELLSLALPQQFSLRSFPAWSPDGRKILSIVEQNEGFSKIIIIETQSGRTEDFPVKDFQDVEQVVWLPKRNALVASARTGRNFQLWEIDYPSGNQIRRITNDLNDYQSPRISADGTKILTAQRNFYSNLWALDEENKSNQKQLTFGTSNHVGYHGIDYFSNGEIIYASNEGESSDVNLWRVNPNDNVRRQLTEGAGSQNKNPCVSPGDKYIYFSSNRGEKAHIWRIEANGENPAQMTFSENSAENFPNISPNGEWLYFIRKDGKASAVWRKSLTANREERVTDEKQFAPANSLALSPDGKRLAFQNLTEQIDSENTNQNFQIAVVETANPQNVKFFSIGGAKMEIYWTNDGAAFDFVVSAKGNDQIRRLNLDENIGMQIIRQFPKENIFTIARSKDGRTIALSRGQKQTDAVLLTNLE